MTMDVEFTANMAELAEAAYALFDSEKTVRESLIDSGFAESQTDAFLQRWNIIHHQPDTESGFSATLFKSKNPNAEQPYVLAIRGTAGFQDLVVTDGSDIVVDGLAIDQIVDLWNYWGQLTTPKGQAFTGAQLVTLEQETAYLAMAKTGQFIPTLNMTANTYLAWLYSRTDIIIDNGPFGERVRTIEVVSLGTDDPDFSGVLDTPLTADLLSGVTGHSLGGHLSAALTRLVPGIEALTINGAGFMTGVISGVGADAELNVRNLFGLLGGLDEFDPQRILNLYGDKMPEFVTQNQVFGLVQQGGHDAIFIEQDPWHGHTLGHGSAQMTDSLAIYRLLNVIDGAIAVPYVTHLLEAAANVASHSLEGVLNAVGDLLGAGTSVGINDREAFYARLSAIYEELLVDPTALEPELKPAYEGLRIVETSSFADSALEDTPRGLAYRYALQALNSFSLLGLDYDAHNIEGALDLYDPATGQGELTPEWLRDRAELLHWKSELALIDGVTDPQIPLADGDRGLLLEDRATGQIMHIHEVGDVSQIIFGKNDADLIESPQGSLAGHRFYGGGGNDTLKGEAGNDYLEGDSGNDILIGGAGNDTLIGGTDNDRYEFSTGDGHDTLIDADGLGGLWIDGVHYTLAQRWAPDADSWHSDDGKIKFLRSGSDLLVLYGQGDSILIRNYVVGALGLRLEETEVTEVPSHAGLVSGTLEIDYLAGTAGDELILGLSGNDWVNYDDNQGGNDTIVGGAGSDRLFGGSGNDRIYAYEIDEYGPPSAVGPNGGITGDWLDGRDGDDLLVGSGGNDGLFGGAGSDTILGGDGDDIILADTTTWGLQNTPYFQVRNVAIGQDQQPVVTVSSFVSPAPRNQAGNDVVFAGEGNDIVDGYAGNDYLEGNGGHDFLLGGEGNDTLNGGEGNDTLHGDGFDGMSEAFPSARLPGDLHGDDLLIGGQGNDQIYGNGGSDRLYGNQGNDTLIGDDRTTPAHYHGNDFLDGGADSDVLLGMGGDDTLYGGEGNDWLAGEDHLSLDQVSSLTGNDWLDGGAGNDNLLGGNGDDYLDGGEGLDNLWGGVGNDTLKGGADADYLKDEDGENFFEGGSGDDTLEGGGGNDRYFFSKGDGVDFLTDKGGINSVTFGEGVVSESLNIGKAYNSEGVSYLTVSYEGGTIYIENGMAGAISDFYFHDGSTLPLSTMLAEVGGLTLFAPESGGQLQGSDAGDILSGSLGHDLIDAAGGNDHLYGNGGNDTLFGGAGDDSIAGGSGDDHLQGDAGNDTLVGGTGNDTLLGGGGDDGLSGGGGQDWLVGSEGNDTLSGGAGDDTLEGGAGVDTYLFSAGSGHDLIRDDDGEYSVLKLSRDIALADLQSRREGNDLLIEYKDGSHSLRIESYYSASVVWEVADDDGRSQSMDAFLFELSENSSMDITFWENKFKQQVQAAFATQHEENGGELENDGYFHYYRREKSWESDGAYGAVFKEFSVSDEPMFEYEGAYFSTIIQTSAQRDEYVATTKSIHSVSSGGLFSLGGGAIYVSASDMQKLSANQGVGYGTQGSYTPVYSSEEPNKLVGVIIEPSQGQGEGQVSGLPSTVIAYSKYWSWDDTVYKVINGDDQGRTYRVGRGQIIRAGSGSDLMIGYPGSLETKNMGVYFSGGAGEDTLLGSYEADYLIGGTGNDLLMGGGGADTYVFYSGDGVDIVNDFPLPSNTDFNGEGGYTYLETSEAAKLDKIVLPQTATLESVTLAWGQVLAQVNAGKPEWFQADGSNEVFYNSFGEPTHRSLRVLVTLDINLGDGQVIRVVMPSSDSPQGSGVELYQLGDGSILTQKQLLDYFGMGDVPDISTQGQELRVSDAVGQGDGYFPLQGMFGNDTLYSGEGDDYLIGGGGDDLLYGSQGYDILEGGLGADTYYIYSNNGDYDSRNVTRIRDVDGVGAIFIDDVKLDKSNLVAWQENYWLSRDGVFSLHLNSESADLEIQTLQGRIVIEDYVPEKLGINLPAFNSENLLAEIVASVGMPWEYFVPISLDDNGFLPELTAVLDNDEQLPQWLHFDPSTGRVSGAFEALDQLEHVIINATYPGGSVVQYELLLSSQLNYVEGTDEPDLLAGTKWGDYIFAGNGDDNVSGGEGDDLIEAGEGHDVLDGGLGADTLYGGQGNDVYVVDQAGDVVTEYPDEGIDQIISTVSWTLGDNLENLSLVGSSAIDGTGNDWDNELLGNSGDNILRGMAGDDLLNGGLGNDTYIVGNGDGGDVINNLSVAAEAETDILRFEDINHDSLWFSRQGSNLVIDVMGAEDSVTVQNWYANSNQQLDIIQAGSSSLYANQVDNLVNAMAAFGAPAGGEINLTQAQRDQLNVAIAANWQ
ncbi:Ca2+-binding protein, RTX toxin-related [Pseudomonas flavescens]|uniref:Ca2+-binding protein, RTX toxin-related n=1 Tax=Phytopseudomonas flavescens TaxID=29435 RepID=A0A1G8KGH0_9GAMM|nr:hypothetical protein [Pseudomonas flavescens]SDI42521.1 Ca2+-binding protein, RTX toxin-related [Pseudomonas flavescens]